MKELKCIRTKNIKFFFEIMLRKWILRFFFKSYRIKFKIKKTKELDIL